jgi:hypothetical protein
MYAKLFSRITESSIMEEPINVRYTFVLMLAIADPEGYVIGTDIAIARRLNMPLEEFERCIEVLMAPDPHSNSKELDGVRLVNSEGERGYRIVNFVTYREMKSPEERRAYMRQYMQTYRKRNREEHLEDAVNSVNIGKANLAGLTHGEAEAEAYPVSGEPSPGPSKNETGESNERSELIASKQTLLDSSYIAIEPLPPGKLEGNVFKPLIERQLGETETLVRWFHMQLGAEEPICQNTRADLLFVLAAAEHALTTKKARNRVAVFVSIVSRKSWRTVKRHFHKANQNLLAFEKANDSTTSQTN